MGTKSSRHWLDYCTDLDDLDAPRRPRDVRKRKSRNPYEDHDASWWEDDEALTPEEAERDPPRRSD
mgnify:CR=1 FL=1|jgi:hypothetical protein